MNILGIGIIFSGGIGIDSYENALKLGWQNPSEADTPHLKNKTSPAFTVNLETAADRSLLKKTRRSDKFSKMAVLAASGALQNSRIENINRKNIGVILATAFGAHVTTFDFLDNILDYGEAAVSPTTFSNSVHNAAASYITSVLDIHGPTLTVTNFYFCFQYALQLAQAWINEGRHDYVLVGAVEQYGDVMRYVYDQKLTPSHDGKIRPFNFSPVCQVPGEGAVFFLMSRENSGNVYCRVEDIRFGNDTGDELPVDLNIIDTDGMLADESAYRTSISPDIPAAAYSPIFGSMMISSAFNCAAGALMLKNQVCYANPVRDNPHGINILNAAQHSNIELIRCVRYNCHREKAVFHLKKIDPKLLRY